MKTYFSGAVMIEEGPESTLFSIGWHSHNNGYEDDQCALQTGLVITIAGLKLAFGMFRNYE